MGGMTRQYLKKGARVYSIQANDLRKCMRMDHAFALAIVYQGDKTKAKGQIKKFVLSRFFHASKSFSSSKKQAILEILYFKKMGGLKISS